MHSRVVPALTSAQEFGGWTWICGRRGQHGISPKCASPADVFLHTRCYESIQGAKTIEILVAFVITKVQPSGGSKDSGCSGLTKLANGIQCASIVCINCNIDSYSHVRLEIPWLP